VCFWEDTPFVWCPGWSLPCPHTNVLHQVLLPRLHHRSLCFAKGHVVTVTDGSGSLGRGLPRRRKGRDVRSRRPSWSCTCPAHQLLSTAEVTAFCLPLFGSQQLPPSRLHTTRFSVSVFWIFVCGPLILLRDFVHLCPPPQRAANGSFESPFSCRFHVPLPRAPFGNDIFVHIGRNRPKSSNACRLALRWHSLNDAQRYVYSPSSPMCVRVCVCVRVCML